MGGRSREQKSPLLETGNFAFVSGLSDSRLDAYGKYSSIAYQSLDTGSFTQIGVPQNHEGLNKALVNEYRDRFGKFPDWALQNNLVADYNRRKTQGFKDE